MKVKIVCTICGRVQEIKYIPDSNHSGSDPVSGITLDRACKNCVESAVVRNMGRLVRVVRHPTKDGLAKPID